MAAGDCEVRVEIIETPTVKVEVFRGPSGKDGADGAGITETKIAIATTLTGIADSVPLATIRAVKWLLAVTDNTTGEQSHSEIWAGHDGVVASHVRYGIFSAATPVPHTVAVVVVGGNMELQVTNNSANTITSRAVRVQTST